MASWFRAKMPGPAGAGQAPPPKAYLGVTCPTLNISGQVHRVPGIVSVELEALPATQRTACFPVDHTSQQVSHPRRGRVPREDLGTWGQGGVLATVLGQVERAWAGGTHAHGRVLLRGVRPVPLLGGKEPCFG